MKVGPKDRLRYIAGAPAGCLAGTTTKMARQRNWRAISFQVSLLAGGRQHKLLLLCLTARAVAVSAAKSAVVNLWFTSLATRCGAGTPLIGANLVAKDSLFTKEVSRPSGF